MKFLDVINGKMVDDAVKKAVKKQFDKHIKPQVESVFKEEFLALVKQNVDKILKNKSAVVKIVLGVLGVFLYSFAVSFVVYKLYQFLENFKKKEAVDSTAAEQLFAEEPAAEESVEEEPAELSKEPVSEETETPETAEEAPASGETQEETESNE